MSEDDVKRARSWVTPLYRSLTVFFTILSLPFSYHPLFTALLNVHPLQYPCWYPSLPLPHHPPLFTVPSCFAFPIFPCHPPAAFRTSHTLMTMGVSWQTPEQKTFIGEHLSSYVQHSADGTLRTVFWPEFLDKWFEAWPTPELAHPVEDERTAQDAIKAERTKKIAVSATRLPADRPELTVRVATKACLQSRLR